jgi:putative DNA primase/helicase
MLATDVARRFGLRRYPRSWRGRCPCCDYPGTFSVRAGRNGQAMLYCASCQDRDALGAAVARASGAEYQPVRQHDVAANRKRNQDRAMRLWRGSESAIGTPADVYLTRRRLPALAVSPALRFRDNCPHPEGAMLAAMIALVCDMSGTPLAVHRTFLTRDGHKATVEPAKASLGPVWGGAIHLSELIEGTPLVVGEGIETAASAGRLTGFPAWAAIISAGNMAKGLVLPPEARRVVIAADPDSAGGIAARDAWLRWRAEGRAVQIAVPDGAGDFNDLLRVREVGRVGRR